MLIQVIKSRVRVKKEVCPITPNLVFFGPVCVCVGGVGWGGGCVCMCDSLLESVQLPISDKHFTKGALVYCDAKSSL